ncbi:uncharacterized protein LOC144910990 isoform X1 [Branchiostoma floridae x Branchiostoma belcheri]
MKEKGDVAGTRSRAPRSPHGPRTTKPDFPPPPPPRGPSLKHQDSVDSKGMTSTDKHVGGSEEPNEPSMYPRLDKTGRSVPNMYSSQIPALRSSGDTSSRHWYTSQPQKAEVDRAFHESDESRTHRTLPARLDRRAGETEDQIRPLPVPGYIRRKKFPATRVKSLDEAVFEHQRKTKPPPLPTKKRRSAPNIFQQLPHMSEAPPGKKVPSGTRKKSLPTLTLPTFKTLRQISETSSMGEPEEPDQALVRHWTRKDVKAWIKTSWPKHLQTYKKKFYSKKINGEALLTLTEERLTDELKVQQPEDRSAIMDLVKTLRTAGSKERLVDEQDEEMFHSGPLYQNSEVLLEHQDDAGTEEQGAGIFRGRTKSFWRDFSMVKKDARVEQLQDNEVALHEAKYEIIKLHVSLLKSLKVLVDVFESDETLLSIMGQHNQRRLFANTDALMSMTRSLLQQLKQSFNRDVMMTEFLALDTYDRYLVDYHKYCRTAAYQQALLQKLLQESSEFAVRIDQLEIYPRCCGNKLESFLKIPFQHIVKLKTVFEGILRHAPKGSNEERSADEIIKALEQTSEKCEEAVATMTESLALQKKLIFDKTSKVDVASPNRWLERVGEFSELRGGRISSPEAPVMMFVFNDMILLAQRASKDDLTVLDYALRPLVEVQPIGQALCRAFGMEDLYQITLVANHRGVMEELVLHPETSGDVDLLLSIPAWEEQVSDEDVQYGVITESFLIMEAVDKPIAFKEGDVVKIYGGLEETRVHAVRMTDGQTGVLPANIVSVVSGESGGYGSRERCTSATVVPKHLSSTQDPVMMISRIPSLVKGVEPIISRVPSLVKGADPAAISRVPSLVKGADPAAISRVPSLVKSPVGTAPKGSLIGGSDSNQSLSGNIKQYSNFDALWSQAQERLDALVKSSSDKFNMVSSNFAAGVFDERGGHLSILEKGISLFIPPGAIAGGPTKVYIYLESIDVHQDENLPDGQAMMSSTLYCGPPGTQFNEDVVFTLPYQGSGYDAMWKVFPVQTQTAVGETPNWRSLTDDVQAMHFLSNGFCTYFVSHFTGFGVVGDFSRSGGAKIKIFRFGAFASPMEMRGNNRRVRVRCWEGKKSELERVLQLEKTEHSGKLIDAHRPLPLREGQGDVWLAATDTSSGWQLRGCGEQSIPEILLWMEEDEPVDPSCTFEFRKANEKSGQFGCTVKIHQEQTPNTSVRLSVTDFEEPHQVNSFDSPNEWFLRLQPELQPIKQDGALLPPSAHRQICTVLDVHNPLGNDWRAFAEKLGLQFDTICWVEGKRPTARLLYYWEHTNADGGLSALRSLKQIFQELEREDVAEILKDAISHHFTEHTGSSNEGRRSTEPAVTEYRERSADAEQCARRTSDSVVTTKDRGKMPKKGGSQGIQAGRVPQHLSESSRAISVH